MKTAKIVNITDNAKRVEKLRNNYNNGDITRTEFLGLYAEYNGGEGFTYAYTAKEEDDDEILFTDNYLNVSDRLQAEYEAEQHLMGIGYQVIAE